MVGSEQPRIKIALTGASGFVGGYVLEALAQKSVDITAYYHKSKPNITDENSIHWQQLDIGDIGNGPFQAMGRPDVLVHLAWGGLPNYRDNFHTLEELPRQKRFLKALIDDGLQSLFVVGTCFEYGMVDGCLSEKMTPKPHLAYGEAKVQLLDYLIDLQKKLNFKLTWGRLFYLFGDGQGEKSLFSQFQKAVVDGDATFNMSAGEQERDFLPIEIAAEIIANLALKRRDAGIVNICSGKPTKVRSLVEGWRKELDAKIDLNLGFYPYPDYEAMAFWGDDRKLKQLLEG